jgi:hypothetical protein
MKKKIGRPTIPQAIRRVRVDFTFLPSTVALIEEAVARRGTLYEGSRSRYVESLVLAAKV